jgi:hypothetical protein
VTRSSLEKIFFPQSEKTYKRVEEMQIFWKRKIVEVIELGSEESLIAEA